MDALRDAVPTCYLQGIDRQKVMLPEETVDFEVLAEDDFGVKQTGIEWSGQFTRPSAEAPAKGELKLADGAIEERRIIKPASFSPAAFGIAPQKITLRGYVEDHFPERGRIYSEPITLYVLTRDEHVQMLKSKFDRNITEFEDLARREQELLDENQRLERLNGEELQKEETAKRLETQEQAEAESKRRMENLTERMEELMKDAARNGDVQKETLKKMAESLKSMQELSQKDLPKVQEKLGDSQEQSNTPEKAQQDVAKAVEEQKKAVEKMQEAIAKANDANRQFEAGTFVNRLKKAAGEQGGIASSLIEAYERILGVKSSKLDPSDQRRLNEASSQQANTASDVRWLQEDLANFFARTQTESFKQILDEMKASQIDIGLEEIRSLLGSNHSYIATENSQKMGGQTHRMGQQTGRRKGQGQPGRRRRWWRTKPRGRGLRIHAAGDETRPTGTGSPRPDPRARTTPPEQSTPRPTGTMKRLISTVAILVCFPLVRRPRTMCWRNTARAPSRSPTNRTNFPPTSNSSPSSKPCRKSSSCSTMWRKSWMRPPTNWRTPTPAAPRSPPRPRSSKKSTPPPRRSRNSKAAANPAAP